MASNVTSSESLMTILIPIYITISIVFGIIGNALVVFIFIYEPTLRKARNIFIIHLAVIDIIISTFLISSVRTTQGTAEDPLQRDTTLCTAVGVITCIIYNVSIAALTVIAIHRYISIVRPMENRQIFSARNCFLFCGAVWIYDGLVCLPPGVGWGRVIYKSETNFCTLDRKFSRSYTIFALFFHILIPSAITIFCYIGLYLRVRKSNRQVQGQTQGERGQRVRKADLKMALQMFIIVAFLYATWGPFLCVTQIDDPTIPPMVIIVLSGLLGINSMVNPFVYLYFNRTFRATFMKIFCRCRKQSLEFDAQGATEDDASITRVST